MDIQKNVSVGIVLLFLLLNQVDLGSAISFLNLFLRFGNKLVCVGNALAGDILPLLKLIHHSPNITALHDSDLLLLPGDSLSLFLPLFFQFLLFFFTSFFGLFDLFLFVFFFFHLLLYLFLLLPDLFHLCPLFLLNFILFSFLCGFLLLFLLADLLFLNLLGQDLVCDHLSFFCGQIGSLLLGEILGLLFRLNLQLLESFLLGFGLQFLRQLLLLPLNDLRLLERCDPHLLNLFLLFQFVLCLFGLPFFFLSFLFVGFVFGVLFGRLLFGNGDRVGLLSKLLVSDFVHLRQLLSLGIELGLFAQGGLGGKSDVWKRNWGLWRLRHLLWDGLRFWGSSRFRCWSFSHGLGDRSSLTHVGILSRQSSLSDHLVHIDANELCLLRIGHHLVQARGSSRFGGGLRLDLGGVNLGLILDGQLFRELSLVLLEFVEKRLIRKSNQIERTPLVRGLTKLRSCQDPNTRQKQGDGFGFRQIWVIFIIVFSPHLLQINNIIK